MYRQPPGILQVQPFGRLQHPPVPADWSPHRPRGTLRIDPMPIEKRDGASLTCSFCGKAQKEVKKLIAGPTVYICDECIGLCNDIIAEEVDREESFSTGTPLPKPAEIKTILDEYVI